MNKITDLQYKIAKNNKISKANVNNRVENLFWDINRAITEPVRKVGNHSELYCDGIRAIARKNGISREVLYKRIKNGMSPYKAAHPLKRKNTKDTKFQLYKGDIFIQEGTAKELARILNIKESTVIYKSFPFYSKKIKNRVKTKWKDQVRIIRIDR